MYTVYILHSKSKSKFYAGQTNDIEDRLHRHNSGQNKSTKYGTPWVLIHTIEFGSRPEAVVLETKIKKRGIRRYLEDINFNFEV
ncbi:GIY-YIG nuclease family protein [Flavobacterium sp. MFBS3-15]|uniref:GIY-YIG nuclease family protein n=1 Tax=Flavobacterium sp. MFBS3-15 TaxID=2989816 RepID=UPI00223560AB|nr:GIY-YIG nuclease family protein [Flavobacterium sp. MFBS3-15]MCW4470179.1 GIY-YIG nuclease family protein [Flavobacterium sp. MFBS3-15]